MDLADAFDALLAAAPADFTAERKRLAGEVRSAGDRDGAAALLKVPKPSAAASALNGLAREDPEAVQEWLGAAEELRDASSRAGQVGGDALRAAMTAHRSATARLVGMVRDHARLSEPMLDRVRALLQRATTDAAFAEAVRVARVVEGSLPAAVATAVGASPAATDAGGSDDRAGKPARGTSGGGTRRRSATSPADVRARAAEDDAARREAEEAARREEERRAREELEARLKEAKAEVERLRDEAARTAAAASAADEALAEAQRTLHRRESEAAAAHDAAADAAQAAAEARRALDALRRSGA